MTKWPFTPTARYEKIYLSRGAICNFCLFPITRRLAVIKKSTDIVPPPPEVAPHLMHRGTILPEKRTRNKANCNIFVPKMGLTCILGSHSSRVVLTA